MAQRKIPVDAFYYYLSLAEHASYEAVAAKYNVSKRAVTALAVKERWQERAREIQLKASAATREKVIETLEAMNERHLLALRVIQSKALEALRAMPLNTALAAVRALDLSIRQERTIRGEPSDRTAVSVEEVIRREYERWMTSSPLEEPGADPVGEDEESPDAPTDGHDEEPQ